MIYCYVNFIGKIKDGNHQLVKKRLILLINVIIIVDIPHILKLVIFVNYKHGMLKIMNLNVNMMILLKRYI